MLKSYVSLIRPLNCFMGVFAILIAIFISAESSISAATIFIASLIGFVAMGAGNILNDYTDIEIDRIAHPHRPLPKGEIEKKNTLFLSIFLFSLSVVLSFFLNVFAAIIVALNVTIMVLYELKLKNMGLTGNIAIGYLVGSLFLFGGAVTESLGNVFILFLLAALSTVGREFVKGIEDIEGDKGTRRTLAVMNIKHAKLGAVLTITIAIILSPLPYLMGQFSILYLAIVSIADVMFIYSLYIICTKNRGSSLMKYAMIIALISFIAGKVIV